MHLAFFSSTILCAFCPPSVTAYVANLAAFMTRPLVDITTMEDAASSGLKICAHPVLRTDLERAWPGANFVFDYSGTEYFGLLDLYEKGECQALGISWYVLANVRDKLHCISCGSTAELITVAPPDVRCRSVGNPGRAVRSARTPNYGRDYARMISSSQPRS